MTADDLLAVSLLGIAWRPCAVRMLIDDHAQKVSGLLAAICSDLDLWDASDADLATVDSLWHALRDMPGVGTATAAKLLARKRPPAVPGHRQSCYPRRWSPGRTWGRGPSKWRSPRPTERNGY